MGLVAENIRAVGLQIEDAARRAGRSPDQVRVVAITKGVSLPRIAQALAAGITHLGENRVQEASAKVSCVVGPVCWHMVGHLQANKVNAAVDLFQRIDSVDSWALAEKLDRRCEALGRDLEILLEVKLTDEPKKTGMLPEDLFKAISRWNERTRLDLKGLMTIGPWGGDEQEIRRVFKALRGCLEIINSKKVFPRPLDVLSMGMSGDFPIAIEEGATEIRIGQALFGPRVMQA